MSGFLDAFKSRQKPANSAKQQAHEIRQQICLDALEQLPSNIAVAEIDSLKIIYLNAQARTTIGKLGGEFTTMAGNLAGRPLSLLYPELPNHIKHLHEPNYLPISGRAQLGNEWLGLRLSAITTPSGKISALLMTWAMITNNVNRTNEFEANIGHIVGALADSAKFLQDTAQGVKADARQANQDSSEASSSADDAHANAHSAAVAAEQLNASIRSMSEQFQTSTRLVAAAVQQGEKTKAVVGRLTDATGKIDAVVKLINEIAGQTNLLALNAMIEAARAGDAGRGFAVVAAEVKDLANQTAQATEDIQHQVNAILQSTDETVQAISEISLRIEEISQIATSIATAVEEQSAATSEIARSVSFSSDNMQVVTERLTKANGSMSSASRSAAEVFESSNMLTSQAESLRDITHKYLERQKV